MTHGSAVAPRLGPGVSFKQMIPEPEQTSSSFLKAAPQPGLPFNVLRAPSCRGLESRQGRGGAAVRPTKAVYFILKGARSAVPS